MTSPILRNIDGPLFRQQRSLLIKLANQVRGSKPIQLTATELDLLEGLITLTDAIADEIHAHYGINSLFT